MLLLASSVVCNNLAKVSAKSELRIGLVNKAASNEAVAHFFFFLGRSHFCSVLWRARTGKGKIGRSVRKQKRDTCALVAG